MWRLSGELAVNCSTLVDLPYARSLMDARRVDGTTRSEVDAERSRRRAALATDTVRSDKYPGAATVAVRK